MYILYYTYMFVCKCLQSPNDQVVFLRITLGIFPNKARPVAVRSPASCGRLESPATVVRSVTGRSVTG